MTRYESIKAILLTGVAFLAGWCLWDAHLALRGVQLRYLVASLEQASKDTASHVNGVADGLGGVIAAERKAQTTQLRESQKVIAAVKEVVVRTDCQLNGGPGCAGVLPSTLLLLSKSQAELQQATSAMNNTLVQASLTLDSLNHRISDPEIDQMIGHLNVASLHLDEATANGNRILLAGANTSEYYEKRLTSPKGFVKTIASGLLQLVSPGAEVFLACCK